jgi:hypothetical protein
MYMYENVQMGHVVSPRLVHERDGVERVREIARHRGGGSLGARDGGADVGVGAVEELAVFVLERNLGEARRVAVT